jgi:hypothetical protein
MVVEANAAEISNVNEAVASSAEWVPLTDKDYKAVAKLCRDTQTVIHSSENLPQPVALALQGIVQLLDEISWWGVNGMPCPDGATSPLFDLAVKLATP